MNETLFLSGYFLLIVTMTIGVFRYPRLDGPMRILVVLLVITACVEIAAYISILHQNVLIKGSLYHVFNIVEGILGTAFFLNCIRPRRYRGLMLLSITAWPLAGMLNMVFLQPPDNTNSNMLMLESSVVITMCLYFIYWLLRNEQVVNIFLYPHFWVAMLWLVLWSSTFFFWAFIVILYKQRWQYLQFAISMQAVMNMLVYTGIAAVLFFYPKMKQLENG